MIEIEGIESSNDAKTYAMTYLSNCRISDRYRNRLVSWVGTYLDEKMLENIIVYKSSDYWDQSFESIKEEAEHDLEIAGLYASASEHFNIDMMIFEGNLLISFNVLLSRMNSHLSKKIAVN